MPDQPTLTMAYIYPTESGGARSRLGRCPSFGSVPALGERYVADDEEEEKPLPQSKPAREPQPIPTAANPDLGESPANVFPTPPPRPLLWRRPSGPLNSNRRERTVYFHVSNGLAEPAAPAPSPCALDATARSIIAIAQDAAVPIDARARETVRRIIGTYYPGDAAKVSGVQFLDVVRDSNGTVRRLQGLETVSEGTGTATRGLIRIGRDFVDGTNAQFFARRVLQVGHELQHIDQWRAGMTGPARSPEREFLAHAWTALTPEKPGTGCMPHTMRVRIIDAALGNLNCLAPADRARHAQTEARLLALRTREDRATGRAATTAPSTCVRSH